jgi:hypothetical protein
VDLALGMPRFVIKLVQIVTGIRRVAPAVVATATAAIAIGCGASADEENAAASVARAFHAAVANHDGAQACGLLAPQTRQALERTSRAPCAQAVLAGKLATAGDVRKVDLAGDRAQVALARDTVFLTVLAENWKIVAAGCRPRGGEQPYACLIAQG